MIVLGASNRPWDIDEAIQRRLSRSFKVGLPSFNQRVQILRVILCPDPSADVSMDDINEIAKRTDKCVNCNAGPFAPSGYQLLKACSFLPSRACCCRSYSGSDLHELCRAAAFGPVRAAVDEMVAEQQQGQAGLTRSGDAMDNSNTSSQTSRCLRKLVLDDFLEVIGGGDALTKESSKEYQQDLASNRRKAAGSRSNTYRPGANMPDVAWKPPNQGSTGGGETEADTDKEAGARGESDTAEGALRAVLSGTGGGGREDILTGTYVVESCRSLHCILLADSVYFMLPLLPPPPTRPSPLR